MFEFGFGFLVVIGFWFVGAALTIPNLGMLTIASTLVNYVGYILILVGGFGCVFSAVLFLINLEVVPKIKLDSMNWRANRLARQITDLFVDDVLVNQGLVVPARFGFKVPVIKVYVADDLNSGFVLVENLGNFSKLNRSDLLQSLSGLLVGNAGRFTFVGSELDSTGNFMRFHFNDLSVSHRLIVENDDVTGYVIDWQLSQIRLADDLIWDSSPKHGTPHLAVASSSGSGKTTLLKYICRVSKLSGWQVEFCSAKNDKLVREFTGEYEPVNIINLLEKHVDEMNRRLALIASKDVDDYIDLNLKPILIVLDEIGSLNAALSDKSNKLLNERLQSALKILSQKARSAGIKLVLCSQSASSADNFVVGAVKVNLGGVIILGQSAGIPRQKMYLLENTQDSPFNSYKFGVGQGIAYFERGSGIQYQTEHYFESPLFVQVKPNPIYGVKK